MRADHFDRQISMVAAEACWCCWVCTEVRGHHIRVNVIWVSYDLGLMFCTILHSRLLPVEPCVRRRQRHAIFAPLSEMIAARTVAPRLWPLTPDVPP